ncbi:hypothetical protein [Candidatus Ruminimicrobiellum ovillum]|uniref:hypothetical protein n=1 Tax=Candidatus Ruminimicrobiellum ovillum TaxID=1947927 RepID=UPI003559EA2C
MITVKRIRKIIANSKSEIREKIIKHFLKENSGTSSESSKYEYKVEKYKNYEIVLKRPGFKKCFDFSVNTKGVFYKKNKNKSEKPKIEDIVKALDYSKEHFSTEYKSIKQIINQIFNVETYDLSSVQNIKFIDAEGKEHPIAVILLALKWLFVAEDVFYWNWSGRNATMNKLREKNLV